MDVLDKPPQASWFRPRFRKYLIKERPQSYVRGNYRKLDQIEIKPMPVQRQSMPPALPARSPLTRLQTVPSFPQMGPQTATSSPQSKAQVDCKTTEIYEDNGMETNESNTKNWTEAPHKRKNSPF